MKQFGKFLRTTFIGGFLIVLPIAMTVILMRWIFNFVSGQISPLTKLIIGDGETLKIIGDAISLAIIIIVFFLIGLTVKTRLGKYLFSRFEEHILKIAPGYSLFKETLKQLVGQHNRPFSKVVLGRVFGNETLMTGFVTDEHPDGRLTIFFPSALNPTTGLLCHMRGEDVTRVDVSVETAMRTIIGCGTGASELFKKIKNLD